MWPPGLCTLPALGAASAVVESTGRTGHGGLLIWFVHFHWVKQVEQQVGQHTHTYIYIIYRVYVCVYMYFLIDTSSHVYIYIHNNISSDTHTHARTTAFRQSSQMAIKKKEHTSDHDIYIYIDKTQQICLTHIYQQMVITALATSGVAVELSKICVSI